jgi:two-component system chemotaxis response regulator CheB
MSQRVSISTASSFLALVIRKTLARSAHLDPSNHHRTASTALAALREPASLAIVDAELLWEGAEGVALGKELFARRTPSIIIDARARGIPAEITLTPSIVVVRGRLTGELDLGVIETELLAAVGNALRLRGNRVSDTPASPSWPVGRAEAHGAALELIVIGVSTGGPSLLLRLFEEVTEPAIPILIAQHMPESETPGFAARLSEHCGLLVREVAVGPLGAPGMIGVLRGGCDFRVVRRDGGLHLRRAASDGNLFHPNVDLILSSAVAADVAVGAVILTGMGHDGAAGALEMVNKGLPVIAQRPDTCAVAGMPQAVIDNGAARWVQSPEVIAITLNSWSEAARRGAQVGRAQCLP